MSQQNFNKLKNLIFIENESFVASQLQISGLYLIAFEMLKDAMRDLVITLNSRPEIHNREVVDITKNEKKILEDESFNYLLKGKNAYSNQVHYLSKLEIINDNEKSILIEWLTPSFRNDVAHRLIAFLIDDTQQPLDLSQIKFLAQIIAKIDNWKIKNYEAAISPEEYEKYSDDELDAAISVPCTLLNLIVKNVEKSRNPTKV